MLLHPVHMALFQSGTYRRVSSSALAIGSTPVAGSAADAFDLNYTNGFVSNETGAGCVGVSYIGQNFVIPTEVRRIQLYNGYNNDAANYGSTSQKLQYSFDGSTWVDFVILSTPSTAGLQEFFFERSLRVPQWRVICNATPPAGGNRWGITELTMWSRV